MAALWHGSRSMSIGLGGIDIPGANGAHGRFPPPGEGKKAVRSYPLEVFARAALFATPGCAIPSHAAPERGSSYPRDAAPRRPAT
ncbi:hypothetical protein CHELA20_52352 [Hyphomicrobiales bacterium]|nr:hypothetical protein CHELA41_22569 [Hyphomicrobiales bacterium]CAH1681633.1 hypothetical protein CHELA20_52352 [Hyphomicrobiales bacterium]